MSSSTGSLEQLWTAASALSGRTQKFGHLVKNCRTLSMDSTAHSTAFVDWSLRTKASLEHRYKIGISLLFEEEGALTFIHGY